MFWVFAQCGGLQRASANISITTLQLNRKFAKEKKRNLQLDGSMELGLEFATINSRLFLAET
jgi:hypothetical protein